MSAALGSPVYSDSLAPKIPPPASLRIQNPACHQLHHIPTLEEYPAYADIPRPALLISASFVAGEERTHADLPVKVQTACGYVADVERCRAQTSERVHHLPARVGVRREPLKRAHLRTQGGILAGGAVLGANSVSLAWSPTGNNARLQVFRRES